MNALEIKHPSTDTDLSGKYLTFYLNRGCYGIPALNVREIIRTTAITVVPQMPDYIKGVINLRGNIIPVVDLCARFGLERAANNAGACIVVVHVMGAEGSPVALGMIVDAVEEVSNFSSQDIEVPPDFGTAIDTSCILGMAKSKTGVKMLLDVSRAVGTMGQGIRQSI